MEALQQEIRRVDRNLGLVNGLLLLFALSLLFNNRHYLASCLGAAPVDLEKVAWPERGPGPELKDAYIDFVPAKLSKASAFTEETSEKLDGVETKKYQSADYHLARLGKRLLLVKTAVDADCSRLTGFLRPVGTEFDEQFRDLAKDYPPFMAELLPVYLDCTRDRTGGRMVFAFCASLALLGLFNLSRMLRRVQDPDSHPLMQALLPYGPGTPIQVDQELSAPVLKRAQIFFTRHSLIAC